MVNEKIWIPKEASNLKFRRAVSAHCCDKGHREYAETLDTIGESYWWDDKEKDVRVFINS